MHSLRFVWDHCNTAWHPSISHKELCIPVMSSSLVSWIIHFLCWTSTQLLTIYGCSERDSSWYCKPHPAALGLPHTDGIAHSTSRPAGYFGPEISPSPCLCAPSLRPPLACVFSCVRAAVTPVWLTFTFFTSHLALVLPFSWPLSLTVGPVHHFETPPPLPFIISAPQRGRAVCTLSTQLAFQHFLLKPQKQKENRFYCI